MKTDLYIEINGKKTDTKNLIDTAKEIWKSEGNLVKDIQALELYFNTEENKCYYVINDENKGFFAI